MKVAPRIDKLFFSDLLYLYVYAYMPHIRMLQLIEILPSVTTRPKSDIPDILNKLFCKTYMEKLDMFKS